MSAAATTSPKRAGDSGVIKTDIPARMDRLPWSRWHWLVIIALGITWILDGLEVTIVGDIAGVLTKKSTLGLTSSQVAFGGSMYILGAVLGALFFGYLTDRLGRKKLFMVTLGVYLLFTAATAFSFSFYSYIAFRFLTGTGIGGEYAAINSAIDELIPARVRGWVDLAINGSFWVGSILGSITTIFTLNPHILPTPYGWRVSFAVGVVLAVAVLLVRHYVPESPRWLMTHGKLDQANRIVTGIEDEVKGETDMRQLPPPGPAITIHPRGSVGFGTIARVVVKQYPKRTILGLSLFIGQAFLYNAIFFTFALVLTTFYHIPASNAPYYLIAFAVGNFCGPLLIGRLFDTVGRRKMITFTYIFSGVALAIVGYLFTRGTLSAVSQTIGFVVIFFFASAGASAAYLTVSEVFPLELRSMCIAFFYAVGTGVGGFIGPILFGALIQTQTRQNVFYGYLVGAVLMAAAGIVEAFLGVNAERKSLESIATPLSAVEGGDEAQMDYNNAGGETGAGGASGQERENREDEAASAEAAGVGGPGAAAVAGRAERDRHDGHDASGAGNETDGEGITSEQRELEMTGSGNVPFTVSGKAYESGGQPGVMSDTGEGHTTIELHIDVMGGDQMLRDIHITLEPRTPGTPGAPTAPDAAVRTPGMRMGNAPPASPGNGETVARTGDDADDERAQPLNGRHEPTGTGTR